jgi:REP element-mobilizing transposase RayT
MLVKIRDNARTVKTRKPQQMELPRRNWGGSRKGAGRKRVYERKRVEHRVRAQLSPRHPVHVTLRVRGGVPSLRSRPAWITIVRALRAARGRFGLAVVQYAVMGNHLHLLVETEGRESLTRGMRGLVTRLAIRLNRRFDRRGPLFDGRFHARALATPLEVRRGLCYVLQNARRHAATTGRKCATSWTDPRSSAPIFDGWSITRGSPSAAAEDLGTTEARTWLLRIGWRRHGLIDPNEIPGQPRR